MCQHCVSSLIQMMASHPAAMIHKMIQAAKKSESNVGKVRLVLGTARDTTTACGLAACQVTWAGGIIYTDRQRESGQQNNTSVSFRHFLHIAGFSLCEQYDRRYMQLAPRVLKNKTVTIRHAFSYTRKGLT